MLYGCDYYPEHWDRSEWEENARLMRECNMNVVRIAEFSWALAEPQEGVFDFSWLDDAIEILAENGISVIMGTPTATPPKWLFNKKDIVMRDKYRRPRDFGSRRSCCANNTDYNYYCDRIVEKMAEHYKNNKNIIAWQIDNEFGCHNSVKCYCDECRREWGRWLKEKYKTIENLNNIYGTVFWSHTYSDFEDVILPYYTSCEGDYGHMWTHNPSLDMDFIRFSSDSWVKFQNRQIDILRKYTDVPITHNMMGHFSGLDYYKPGERLDVVSWDNYPDNQWGDSEYQYVSMAHEIMRGVKNKNFWVMEEQSGPCGWDVFGATPRPGQLRLWAYQAVAHGCEGMIYFRFKTCPFGMEQYWYGVLDHDGVPRRRYFEIQKTGVEMQRLSHKLVGAENISDVLIVKDYDFGWSHDIKQHKKGFSYENVLYEYYAANLDLGTNPKMGSFNHISDKYKVVYVPAALMINEEIENILKRYVENGGTLVLSYRSGIRDEFNNIIRETLPGRLRELAGITVEEFDGKRCEVELSDNWGKSSFWRDIVRCESASGIVYYKSEYYKDTSAITVNEFGKGRVYYAACDLDKNAMARLVKLISDEAGAEYIEHPSGCELIKRKALDGEEYIMALNHTDKPLGVNIFGKSMITGERFNGTLEPYGIELIK